ncbi:cyanophycinase [Roseomonas sp. SSH11]|uniref:Cyanophycinase n=1 Tax=Pararoseomonas baculiformis TaxID=2820812 RepID=A0ABS4AEJ1_9PROT|nr:cyanophycinase [Pararoseomonas baculiformis]MBP0445271.1 cyanophycinase [Pararoseomonas baculiformis]
MTDRSRKGSGPLIIIGGHEDKDGERIILKEVAKYVRGGRLVIATVASHQPEGYFDAYKEAFGALGVTDLVELYVQERSEAQDEEKLHLFDGATGVFFSGGDQLRISSQLGDTPVERRVREIHEAGGVIAGTSAGASAMSDTMLVKGKGQETHRIGDLHLAAGLGLVRDVIIDQHFAERGRIGRLLGAVAQNPRELGIGIDEDTAIILRGDNFEVIGSGGVYVVDGGGVTHSNIAEAETDRALSIHDVRLHVLCHGDRFQLGDRRPGMAEAQRVAKAAES